MDLDTTLCKLNDCLNELGDISDELDELGVKVMTLGDLSRLPEATQKVIYKAKERTKNNFVPSKIEDYTINRVKFTEEEKKHFDETYQLIRQDKDYIYLSNKIFTSLITIVSLLKEICLCGQIVV